MKFLTNILFFSIIIIFSCEKDLNDVNPIPSVRIAIDIDLNKASYAILKINSAIIINSLNYNKTDISTNLGFNNCGLIIYQRGEQDYLVYDVLCPYEYKTNKNCQSLNIIDDMAVCPICKSIFYLYLNGQPSNKSKCEYYLKQYKINYLAYKIIRIN